MPIMRHRSVSFPYRARIISIFAPLDRWKLFLEHFEVCLDIRLPAKLKGALDTRVCASARDPCNRKYRRSVSNFRGFRRLERDVSENSTEISRSLEVIIPRQVSSSPILILIPEACRSRSGLLRARLISQLAIVSR